MAFRPACCEIPVVTCQHFRKSHPKENLLLLGRHGSASLCRDAQENKMAATYNVLAFKR